MIDEDRRWFSGLDKAGRCSWEIDARALAARRCLVRRSDAESVEPEARIERLFGVARFSDSGGMRRVTSVRKRWGRFRRLRRDADARMRPTFGLVA